MEVIVLGGPVNNGPLREISESRYEAGIKINNRPMIEYVLTELEKMNGIERIIVVTPEGVVAEGEWSKVSLLAPGDNLVDSLIRAVEALRSDSPVLITTSDIPLITKEALFDFLALCKQANADLYYPFIPKEVVEKKYPATRRTYVRLREGWVTGGNVVLVRPKIILANKKTIQQAFLWRKQPLKLCRLLGLKFILKLGTGSLSVKEIEEQVEKIFKLRGVGVASTYPEIGVDVDKPEDLELVSKILG